MTSPRPAKHERSRGIALAVTLVAVSVLGAPSAGWAADPAPTTPVPTSPAPTTPAPTTPAPAPAPKPEPTVTITAVGDTMLGNTPELPPNPFDYMDPIRDELTRKAQIVFMNLEGTLTSAGGGKCGSGSSDCYAFRTPPGYGRVYKAAGFTVANSANNHYNDFGPQGQRDTDRALRAAGIVQTGRPGQIAYVKAGGMKLAFVGFAPYAWASNLLNLPAARAQIKRAKANADQVVVYMHAGAEGADKTHVTGASEFAYGENRGNPKAFAHMAIDAGASLVLGSGPHVLRGMEYYRNRLIAYSLGNFAGFHNFGSSAVTSRSAILRVTLNRRGRPTAGRVFPVTLSASGRPARGGASLSMIRALSKQDLRSRAVRFHDNGELLVP